jgi:hypothetical protein
MTTSQEDKEILWALQIVLPEQSVYSVWQELRYRRRMNLPVDLVLHVCSFLSLRDNIHLCTANRHYYQYAYPWIWPQSAEYRYFFPTSTLLNREWETHRLQLGLALFWTKLRRRERYITRLNYEQIKEDETEIHYLRNRLKSAGLSSTERRTNQGQLRSTQKLFEATLAQSDPELISFLRSYLWNSMSDQYLSLKATPDPRAFGCASEHVWNLIEGEILAEDPAHWFRIHENNGNSTVEEDTVGPHKFEYFDDYHEEITEGRWYYKKRIAPQWWPKNWLPQPV